ncbi:MAG: MBL fold metallo-hydrolase [Parvibaculum sp.]|uniref:MBL fold metallo-hydrolase n=1 Tax=Parvibaculum sp. TaxID=2024848 RepID=UPI0032EEBD3B
MSISLSVHGAAQTVTGSCYLLQSGRTRFLIDCGMFQGSKTLKALNYGDFPFKPDDIDFVLLTHAHIDHSGLIPKLVKKGFAGPIYATHGTIDLLTCMLPDSAHIQETEVDQLNKRNARRGRPEVTPIYTLEDAEAALRTFSPVAYDEWIEPAEGVRARFWNAGHILGSSSIEIELMTGIESPRTMRLLFSGDIGPEVTSFHPTPDSPRNLDYLICEATYGARERPAMTLASRRDLLAAEANEALKGKGVLIVPSFAVERTQELLSDLLALAHERRIPQVPIFLDSPLAIRATEVFVDHARELEDGDAFRHAMRSPLLRTTESVQESMMIERIEGSHIIVAASGMCDAGRIRHHLKNHLWRNNATVLMVGYQAEGTLGRILQNGVRAVRIQGEEVKVNASIRTLDIYSGHADGPGLASWVEERGPVSRGIILVHGEKEGIAGLDERLADRGLDGERIFAPELDAVFDLLAESPATRERPAPRRLQPEFVGHQDWHNDLSRLWLDLEEELDQAADDKARRVILRRIRRALENEHD